MILAHSPDSDDAFMFYALAAGKLDTGALRFHHRLEDIETLNRKALRGEYEVTAVSIHAYAFVADKYRLLGSGASMGDRYGPVVVSSRAMRGEELRGKRVAIPGEMTTAFLALQLYQPDFLPVVVPFDRIMEAVGQQEVEAGLLIHEGQLTYRDEGLHKVIDLGEWWHRVTGLPLPLGGNAVRRDLGEDLICRIARIIRASIEYSLLHREEALEHAMQYARDLKRPQADRFVGMYVNERTLDYGPEGRKAVQELLDRAHRHGIIPSTVVPDFVD